MSRKRNKKDNHERTILIITLVTALIGLAAKVIELIIKLTELIN